MFAEYGDQPLLPSRAFLLLLDGQGSLSSRHSSASNVLALARRPTSLIFSPRPFDSFRYNFKNRSVDLEKEIGDRLEPDFFCGGFGGVAAPMLATSLLKGSEPEEKDPLNCSLSSSGSSIC